MNTAKLPRGPHSLTREQVAEHQRQRIIAATIDVVGKRGYFATTVADVIARAGVSRKAFYEHFENKHDCFLTAFDQIITTGLTQAEAAFRGADGVHAGIEAATFMMLERAGINPLALKLVLVEIGAVGPEGVARRERHMRAYEDLLARSLGVSGPKTTLPKPVLRALVGGVSGVLYEVVQGSRRARREAVVADLATWIMSYHPVPDAMAHDIEVSSATDMSGGSAGGRAPGTLSPRSARGGRRGLRGERASSHSYVVHSQRERILDAVANLNAARGYAATSVRDIADEAAVSLDAFYGHFRDKEDAFLVAYEIGHHKSLAIVEHALAGAPDWCQGVPAALEALFGFISSEPTYAHLALINAPLATPRTAETARKGLDSYRKLFEYGFETADSTQRASPLAATAITSGIFELCSAYVLQGRSDALPATVREVTYLTLTPFIGATAALRIAERHPPLRAGDSND